MYMSCGRGVRLKIFNFYINNNHKQNSFYRLDFNFLASLFVFNSERYMCMLRNVIFSSAVTGVRCLKLISWKYTYKRLNEEYELAQKKKQALTNLYASGKISQSTLDSFTDDINSAMIQIEKQQKELIASMQGKTAELENQIKMLETLLANYEIQHVVGEIDEEIYQREITLLSTGLDNTKNELDTIKHVVSHLCPPTANIDVSAVPEPAAPAIEAPAQPAPIETAPVEPTPVEVPVQAATVETVVEPAPVETPTIEVPTEVTPAQAASIETAPTETAPVIEAAPVETTPVEIAPIAETTPIIVEAPVVETPAAEAAPVIEAPAVEAAQITETPIVETTTVEVTPVVESAPIIEAPVIETAPIAETPIVETPTVVEAAPVEAAPIAPAEPEVQEIAEPTPEIAPQEPTITETTSPEPAITVEAPAPEPATEPIIEQLNIEAQPSIVPTEQTVTEASADETTVDVPLQDFVVTEAASVETTLEKIIAPVSEPAIVEELQIPTHPLEAPPAAHTEADHENAEATTETENSSNQNE